MKRTAVRELLKLTVQPGMVTKAEPGEVYRSQP